MKQILISVIAIIATSFVFACTQQAVNTSIKINSLGYLPNEAKKATIYTEGSFKIYDNKTNKIVYSGTIKDRIAQKDVSQKGFIVDFSEFKQEGEFVIEDENGNRSETFIIGQDVYHAPFITSMRAMYLWRCGMAVKGEYKGDLFAYDACHLMDGNLAQTEFGDKHLEGSGGWHDAGDHGKYIVNAGITAGLMFMAWDNFQDGLKDVDLSLPNTCNELPGYLKELKWETDWFLKMQYPDGSGRVFHKLTRLRFAGFIMPDKDDKTRYFAPFSTDAIASFTANMAQAARYFKPYIPEYADSCLKAAKLSYAYLNAHPKEVLFEQGDFNTGSYRSNKPSSRIFAAAEMWETTGEESYLKDFESLITKQKPLVDFNWDWGNNKNLGIYTYLLSNKENKNTVLAKSIKKQLILTADSVVNNIQNDLYGRPFNNYFWGCNGTVARFSTILYVANQLSDDDKYKKAASEITAHLFGRNYYGRSYITGLGINPPMNPHDRRSGADNVVNPWPGYLVGGGHSAIDWIDEEASFSRNEVAINWQASLIYLLAWMDNQ